ncbi:MAG: Rhomboid family protein [Bacteroidetes bacterium ADurb.Bin408]|nr:MAG: Rhomboid family protein [Bacteroidetes bacterium ADurb.Bin408]
MFKPDRTTLLNSLIFPVSFTALLWLVKIIETLLKLDIVTLGIFPLKLSGLIGILTAPLIHSGIHHLLSNTVGVFLLSWALFYFYREIALWSFILIYFLSGFWVWFFARDAFHIGASGLIYGMASFLFFSGIFRRFAPLIAVSLTIVFLYGGIIWGIFPTIEKISWETHLTGLLAGIIVAIYYKNEGPQKPHIPDDDEDDDLTFDELFTEDEKYTPPVPENKNNPTVNWHYKKDDNTVE